MTTNTNAGEVSFDANVGTPGASEPETTTLDVNIVPPNATQIGRTTQSLVASHFPAPTRVFLFESSSNSSTGICSDQPSIRSDGFGIGNPTPGFKKSANAVPPPFETVFLNSDAPKNAATFFDVSDGNAFVDNGQNDGHHMDITSNDKHFDDDAEDDVDESAANYSELATSNSIKKDSTPYGKNNKDFTDGV